MFWDPLDKIDITLGIFFLLATAGAIIIPRLFELKTPDAQQRKRLTIYCYAFIICAIISASAGTISFFRGKHQSKLAEKSSVAILKQIEKENSRIKNSDFLIYITVEYWEDLEATYKKDYNELRSITPFRIDGRLGEARWWATFVDTGATKESALGYSRGASPTRSLLLVSKDFHLVKQGGYKYIDDLNGASLVLRLPSYLIPYFNDRVKVKAKLYLKDFLVMPTVELKNSTHVFSFDINRWVLNPPIIGFSAD